MVVRIVGVGVGRERAGRAVLEALVDRQDHHLARAAQLAVHQDAGKVGLGAGAIALVVVEDLLDDAGDFHGGAPGRGSYGPKRRRFSGWDGVLSMAWPSPRPTGGEPCGIPGCCR